MNKYTASQSGGLCEKNPEGDTAATLFTVVSLVHVKL